MYLIGRCSDTFSQPTPCRLERSLSMNLNLHSLPKIGACRFEKPLSINLNLHSLQVPKIETTLLLLLLLLCPNILLHCIPLTFKWNPLTFKRNGNIKASEMVTQCCRNAAATAALRMPKYRNWKEGESLDGSLPLSSSDAAER